MNTLVEKGIISEMICGSNFAYILADNASFLATEYKVLQNQKNNCFIRCMKMLYNGKIQIYYLTEMYKSLVSLFNSLNAEGVTTIVANMLAGIIEVKSNGFLACQNIDISFEHVYVDPSTYKVSLVYLPLRQRSFEDYAIFENELRTSLVKLISRADITSSAQIMRLSSDLSNGALTLESLYRHLKGDSGPWTQEEKTSNTSDQQDKRVRVVSLNAPMRIEIDITKDVFILGKKIGQVDGVLSFNDKISRIHCRINRDGNQCTITDLHSTNGTYVNRVRLQAGKAYPIKNGDVVRLANSDFQIVIG